VYRQGTEGFERKGGEYVDTFIVREEQRYDIDLRSLENAPPSTPINFVLECFIDADSIVSLKLLKQYGADEEDDFSITFPSWNVVSQSGYDYEIDKTTSFTKFDELVAVWRKQLTEIIAQTYNVCWHLSEEYKKIASQSRPAGSPISIRSFKTSTLHNTILYVEAVANFLVSIAIAINAQVDGAASRKRELTGEEIEKLEEKNNKYMSLEEKLVYAIGKINELSGMTSKIDKSNPNWDKFKKLKRIRDSLTHVKIKEVSGYASPTLDRMLSSVRILDKNLVDCVTVIHWINCFMDDFFYLLASRHSPLARPFNDPLVSCLMNLVSSINASTIE
jgi:hypothetical protein